MYDRNHPQPEILLICLCVHAIIHLGSISLIHIQFMIPLMIWKVSHPSNAGEANLPVFLRAPQIVRWHINPCCLLTRRLIPSLFLIPSEIWQLYPTYSRYQFAKCLEYSNIQSLLEYTQLPNSELAFRCQKFRDDLMIMSKKFSWLKGFLLDKWVWLPAICTHTNVKPTLLMAVTRKHWEGFQTAVLGLTENKIQIYPN